VNDIKTRPSASNPTGFEFVIRRTFNAPLDRVWRAWSEPEHMAQWWGHKGAKARIVRLDFRPGGICHYHLTAPNMPEIWGKLLYREIVPKERLVFIVSFSDENEGITVHPLRSGWPREILSTVTFSEMDGKTTITVRWVPYEATFEERKIFEDGASDMQAGWTGTFDQLEDYLDRP
jgi:uncharacterized protein YndB with AHSA1/START domain